MEVVSVATVFAEFDPRLDPMVLAKAVSVSFHEQADAMNAKINEYYQEAVFGWRYALQYENQVDTGKPIMPALMSVDDQGIFDFYGGKRKDLPGLINYRADYNVIPREPAGRYKPEDVRPVPSQLPAPPPGYHYIKTPFGFSLVPESVPQP